MVFGTRFRGSMATAILAALISSAAFAQSVTTRLVVGGGSATTAKVTPGGSTSMDVRLDIVAASIYGTSFRLSQTTPATSGFFSITGRSFVGSPFDDPSTSTPDVTVLAPASALLDPGNDDNLGRATVGLVGIPAASNVLAVNLTLTASAATPFGSYTILPTAGISFATGNPLADFSMSTGTPFTIVVGQTLTVTRNGTGTGTVTANSGAINCGAICSDIYPGTVVTLTAAPAGGSTFVGWTGGGCGGTGTCVVTVDAAKSVNAQFDLGAAVTFALNVTRSGTGTGTVTSAPAGINCGATCTANFNTGTLVTLTPTPTAGSVFTNWSGACSGSGACAVTMSVARSVDAVFTLTDVTPPDTTIDSGPTNPSSDATPTFTFSSTEPGSTFRCSLDGAPFAGCTTPRTVAVGNGSHTFQVAATDASGNIDPTPASFAWTAAGIVAPPEATRPIPTLNEWMLALLALAVGSFGVAASRRRS
jgi:Divergent InlB B-repeat domain/IPTL-CTERM motif